jgi:hypothetical protein
MNQKKLRITGLSQSRKEVFLSMRFWLGTFTLLFGTLGVVDIDMTTVRTHAAMRTRFVVVSMSTPTMSLMHLFDVCRQLTTLIVLDELRADLLRDTDIRFPGCGCEHRATLRLTLHWHRSISSKVEAISPRRNVTTNEESPRTGVLAKDSPLHANKILRWLSDVK